MVFIRDLRHLKYSQTLTSIPRWAIASRNTLRRAQRSTRATRIFYHVLEFSASGHRFTFTGTLVLNAARCARIVFAPMDELYEFKDGGRMFATPYRGSSDAIAGFLAAVCTFSGQVESL
jgi:hypothetical protein